ncbi:hypothetical protein VNO78_07915 [Psophocarpus tetragonolobus]|uniref:Uncharacterized protein n=1 Tax=Psophocarpus tetragonolobus TaxID=3891 RepID=A0AAN9SVG4_PSOTE
MIGIEMGKVRVEVAERDGMSGQSSHVPWSSGTRTCWCAKGQGDTREFVREGGPTCGGCSTCHAIRHVGPRELGQVFVPHCAAPFPRELDSSMSPPSHRSSICFFFVKAHTFHKPLHQVFLHY